MRTQLTACQTRQVDVPETQYARSGDVNIAYQVVGEGPIDLVYVPGWISNIEFMWTYPLLAHFLRRLASFARLILFDKRGTGLSDRVPVDQLPTLEQRMDDVRAVMDAVGSERAALFGHSEGGALCALFAATYPERVRALVMLAAFAKRLRSDDYPWAPTAESREADARTLEEGGWGSIDMGYYAPSKRDDPEFGKWLRLAAERRESARGSRLAADEQPNRRARRPSDDPRPDLVLIEPATATSNIEEGRYMAGADPGRELRRAPR